MFNILKKKTIELHCYTDNKMVYDLFPIQSAKNFYPQWWKNLLKYPKIPQPNIPMSIKGCYGFLELYKKSFILPLWCDLLFTNQKTKNIKLSYESSSSFSNIKDDIKISFADSKFLISAHNIEQFQDMVDHNSFTQFKLQSPWLFDCNESVNFIVSDCIYNKKNYFNDIIICSGMMNFLSGKSTNVIGFVNKHIKNDILITAGTPINFFTPITERPVKIICHLDPYKYDILKTDTFFSYYNIKYKKLKELFKKNTGCPLNHNKSLLS